MMLLSSVRCRKGGKGDMGMEIEIRDRGAGGGI
jgi:hypothetical protein